MVVEPLFGAESPGGGLALSRRVVETARIS